MNSERHDVLVAMLGAFADGELGSAASARIEEHLPECERCRRMLQMHRVVRGRLGAETGRSAPRALRQRILVDLESRVDAGRNAVSGNTAVDSPDPRRAENQSILHRYPWLGWMVAAGLAALLAATWFMTDSSLQRPGNSTVDAASAEHLIPMIEDALADYRRLSAGELPPHVTSLAQLNASLPFPVSPIASSGLRMIGAWVGEIRGEACAVLVYWWGEHLVVQYVVSERLFLRQADVRQAISQTGYYSVSAGAQGVLAFPNAGSGSMLVSDLTPQRLVQLRS